MSKNILFEDNPKIGEKKLNENYKLVLVLGILAIVFFSYVFFHILYLIIFQSASDVSDYMLLILIICVLYLIYFRLIYVPLYTHKNLNRKPITFLCNKLIVNNITIKYSEINKMIIQPFGGPKSITMVDIYVGKYRIIQGMIERENTYLLNSILVKYKISKKVNIYYDTSLTIAREYISDLLFTYLKGGRYKEDYENFLKEIPFKMRKQLENK